MTHRTGSYWEMNPLGTYTMKSVLDMYLLAKEDLYSYVGGDYTQQIMGQSYRYTAGDNVIKSDGTIYFDANRVQVNTGMMAVTGEINSPSINAEVFTGPFADVLSKESMLAWDLGHGGGGGSAPAMINNSLGFMGNKGSESLLTNKLAKQSPNGTPIITNGIPSNTPVDPDSITSTAATDTATPLSNATGVSIFSANAIIAAAAAIDAAAISAGNNTPVFIKHVSLDKPILLSQSTVAALPDPSLYVNNLHTIVNPTTGEGELHISNGNIWVPIGTGTDAKAVILGLIDANVGTATVNALVAEAVARQQAILEESVARQQAIIDGVLAEAQARGAAIIAESTIRQSAEQSLSDHIITLTASTGTNAAAIQQEQTARTNGDSTNATATQVVAAEVGVNTASIISNATTSANASSALGVRIDAVTVTTGNNTAAIASESTARTTGDTALGTRVDSVITSVGVNTSSIITNATTAANASSALGVRIDSVLATTNQNTADIGTETTARTTADTALGTRVDLVFAQVGTNTASIISNATTAANASSANASLISALTTTVGGNTTTISTQQTSINGISANYGIKINANGNVSGFGLLSTTVGSTPLSVFTIQADAFRLINPAASSTAVAPFSITANGNLSITGNLAAAGGTFVGTVNAGIILGGSFTNYAWPTSGQRGYYLGPNGIMIGNYNGGGNYFQYDQASGAITMPGITISGGNASFSGNISGAGGTFSGTLTAANIITTGNMQANSITQTAAATGGYSVTVGITSTGGKLQISVYGTTSATGGSPDAPTNGYSVINLFRDNEQTPFVQNGGTNSGCSVMVIDSPAAGYHSYGVNTVSGYYSANPQTYISITELKR